MNTATASALLLGGVLGASAIDAAAQAAFPARPIRMLVGSAPGGGLDVSARALSEPLSAALGQPVLVDNRPGAAGSLSGQILSKAPPDGHTICLGAIGNFAVNYFLYKDIGYHPLKDLAPITGIADATNILVVHPGVPASSVKDLLKLASTQKGLTYGSSGTGNAGHLAGELFAASTKTDLVHIPYKGGGPAIADLIGGQVPMLFGNSGEVMSHAKNERIRVIGVSTPQRLKQLPGIPSVGEVLPGFEITAWQGMLAPAKTPRAVIEMVSTAIQVVAREPAIAERLEQLGVEPIGSTAEQMAAIIKAEQPVYAEAVKAAGLGR